MPRDDAFLNVSLPIPDALQIVLPLLKSVAEENEQKPPERSLQISL